MGCSNLYEDDSYGSIANGFRLMEFQVFKFYPGYRCGYVLSFYSNFSGGVFSNDYFRMIYRGFHIALRVLVAFQVRGLRAALRGRKISQNYCGFLERKGGLMVDFLLDQLAENGGPYCHRASHWFWRLFRGLGG